MEPLAPPVESETRLVLVRHGRSRVQDDGIVGGHDGCRGLSELGRAQVGALARRWSTSGELADVAALYASELPRAIESASLLAAAVGGHQVAASCDLCEHHPGEIDGLLWEEAARRFPVPDGWDPDLRRAPGSETWTEMAARVRRGLDEIIERHDGGTVVVATHGGVIVHSMIRWLGLEPGPSSPRAWFNPANASVTEWKLAPGPTDGATSVELVRFNDHAHLGDL